MNIVWCCRSMPQSWHRGRWRMSGGCWTGSEMNRRGQGKEGERRRKRKEERPYHDITPLLCHYISEWHSFSLTSGVAQGSWSGGGRGAQSVRMLKVEFLSHCWGVDFSIGDHMLSELDQPRNLTRYHSLPHLNLESRISSTSYSSWLLTVTGPGHRGCGHSAISSGM